MSDCGSQQDSLWKYVSDARLTAIIVYLCDISIDLYHGSN